MSHLTFKRENYDELIEEIKPLLFLHHKELAMYQDSVELSPDFDSYKAADNLGILVAISGRDEQGCLKGYAVYVVAKHNHYTKNLWGTSDIFWMHPDERNAGNGRNLFLTLENELKASGVSVMHTTLKVAHPAARYLLESMGHNLIEFGMSKRLD